MTNLRKAIFYIQQSLIRDHNDNIDLLYILDLLCEFDKHEKLNTEIVKLHESCPLCGSDDLHQFELTHSKCKKCNCQWTS